ncbi:hypothetical protein BC629DRAFT_1591218 [Irpex lacteus]|nr:hypothetical protein BC629DRAFT_1591218 [Irpex lacteus]
MGDIDYDDLSDDVKRVVQGIRGVEESLNRMHVDFAKEVHALEKQWARKFQTAYERRRILLTGESAPTVDEIAAGEKRSKHLDEDYHKLPTRGSAKAAVVPNFWLTTLQANLDTGAHVLESDEPALRHLTNITITYPHNPKGHQFDVEFYFAKNQYFTNSVLKLGFVYQNHVDAQGNLAFSHVTGDKINWKPGKNLVKGNSSHRHDDDDEEEEETSFFALFSPDTIITRPASNADDEEEREYLLDHAFDIGLALKKSILSRATDYFIGDGDDLDSDEDDNDWSDFEDSDEDS